MVLVVRFCMSTVDPIQNVKKSVGTHEKDVVPRQVLDLTVTLQDNELRQDRNGLQVDRKCPEQLHKIKVLHATSNEVRNDSNDSARSNSESPMQESILGLVVSRLDGFLVLDGEDNRCGSANVQNLHYGVVDRIESGEQIQIPSHKDQKKQLMCSNRDTCSGEEIKW